MQHVSLVDAEVLSISIIVDLVTISSSGKDFKQICKTKFLHKFPHKKEHVKIESVRVYLTVTTRKIQTV